MQTIIESTNNEDSNKQKVKIIIISIVVAVLLYSIFLYVGEEQSANSAEIAMEQLTTSTVRSGNLIQDVRAPGNLISNRRQWLSARMNAKVIKRELEPGALVNPESIILRLSSPELTQEFKRVQIDYKVAQAQLDALKETQKTELQQQLADVKLLKVEKLQAIEDAQAKKGLIADKIIPLYQYNEAVLREEMLTLELEIAEFELQQLPKLQESLLNVELAKVEQQLLQVTLLGEQVEMLNVRAQIDGVLQSISVEEGQEVSQGAPLARVSDQHDLKAELRVQESQAKDIQIGQMVEIDTRRSKINGIVSRIDPSVVNGTVTIDVALPDELPSDARPDLRVNGIVEIQRLENILLLDKPANWKDSQTTYLYKITNNSLASRIKVDVGATSTTSVQLLKGLSEGDRVILSDTSAFQQHSSIAIN